MVLWILMFDVLVIALGLTIIGGGYILTLYYHEVKEWITRRSKTK